MDCNDPTAWSSGLSLLNNALGALKAAKDLLPNTAKKRDVEDAVNEAEKALKLAEAKIAADLNYELCRCTFPPQIMLEKPGENPTCSLCGNMTEPIYGE